MAKILKKPRAPKMPTIEIDIPEEILVNYKNVDEVKKEIFEDFIADEYKKGNITIRQGAKMLGLTYEEFMVNFLGNRKISIINGTHQELESEYLQEKSWLDETSENK